jgi:hypothetical protein
MGGFVDCEFITLDFTVLEGDVKAVNILGKKYIREIDDKKDMFEIFVVR